LSSEENKRLVRRLAEEALREKNLDGDRRVASGGREGRGSLQVLGTHRGEWLGLPATGRRFEDVDEIYVFTVRDGKLVSALGVEDNLTRVRQLGIEPRLP
jgi:hypothetical protein